MRGGSPWAEEGRSSEASWPVRLEEGNILASAVGGGWGHQRSYGELSHTMQGEGLR
jgi:hypothetical protein